jgi:hypothetical protein
MIRRLVVLVGLAASACNQTQPSAPTPSSAENFTLHGLVLDEAGTPVAGARVTVHYFSARNLDSATVTDANGSYQLSYAKEAWPFGSPLITVSKAGYEDSTNPGIRSPYGGEATLTCRLYQIITIAAGEKAHLLIGQENSWVSYDGEWHWADGATDLYPSRAVHVMMPSSGTLVLDLDADDSVGSFGLLRVGNYQDPPPIHLRLPMNADSAVAVVVRTDADMRDAGNGFYYAVPRGVTLKTSLAP